MRGRAAIENTIDWDFASGCLEASAVHLFHRAGQCADEIFTRKMGQNGITRRQFAVLIAVARSKQTSLNDLVRKTAIGRPALASIVDRMIDVGLVRRRGGRYVRAYQITLTRAGRTLLEAVEPVAIQADNQIWGALPRSRRRRFFSDLAAIVKVLGGRDFDAQQEPASTNSATSAI